MWDFGFYFVTFAPYLRPHPLLWSHVLRFPLSIYHFSPPQPQFLLSFYLHTSLLPPLFFYPFISCPLPSTFIASLPFPPTLPHPLSFWSVGSASATALTLARFSSVDLLPEPPPSSDFIPRIREWITINSSLQEARPCPTAASLGGLVPTPQVDPGFSAS